LTPSTEADKSNETTTNGHRFMGNALKGFAVLALLLALMQPARAADSAAIPPEIAFPSPPCQKCRSGK
jgi:hypothetical protein